MAALQVDFLINGHRLDDGTPNAGGKVYFFTSGTETTKPVYSSKIEAAYDTVTAAPPENHVGENYVLLDSYGKPQAEAGGQVPVFASGTYDIKIYDTDNSLVDTLTALTYEVAASVSGRVGIVKTASFDIQNNTDIYFINAAGATTGTFDFTAASTGPGKQVMIVNMAGGTCTINPVGEDTFNNQVSWSLDKTYEFVRFESPGAGVDWMVTSGASPNDLPQIASFINAVHDHADAAGGGATLGAITVAALVADAITADDITITDAAASPPDTNTLTKENIVKAWVNFDGTDGTVNDNFNVNTVTDEGGLGDFTIVWETDFANANYCVHGTAQRVAGNERAVTLEEAVLVVGSARIIIFGEAHTAQDATKCFIMAIGDQ